MIKANIEIILKSKICHNLIISCFLKYYCICVSKEQEQKSNYSENLENVELCGLNLNCFNFNLNVMEK